ncbi:MAG: insulinase family protein [Bacteroidales bacterium]|nr:insulinase family protein [Bacteroidales bacterium]
MMELPAGGDLQPRMTDHGIGVLQSSSTPLVRIDVVDEAGSAYQAMPLCASAALRLHTCASATMSQAEVSEWIDYRGVVLEHTPDVLAATTTVYTLSKYAQEVCSLLAGLRREPLFPQREFDVYRAQRRQEVAEAMMRPRDVARRLWYSRLFGREHPLGRYATTADAERLSLDEVRRHYAQRFNAPRVLLSGAVDAGLERAAEELLGSGVQPRAVDRVGSLAPMPGIDGGSEPLYEHIDGTTQASLRAGRVLPVDWRDPDYAGLMLLTTLLGGYFGSRLMGNLREDKGYTYGVYARTQLYRGCVVFYIAADVAAHAAGPAEAEVRRELRRLAAEEVDGAELDLVKTVMAGDFMRSVDGVFERAERVCGMVQAGVDETLTDNLRGVLASATPSYLRSLAAKWLREDDMVYCRAGNLDNGPQA